MDNEIEQELERIRNLSFDERVSEGYIIPAQNTSTRFPRPTFKLKGKKSSTELLIEERRSARF